MFCDTDSPGFDLLQQSFVVSKSYHYNCEQNQTRALKSTQLCGGKIQTCFVAGASDVYPTAPALQYGACGMYRPWGFVGCHL